MTGYLTVPVLGRKLWDVEIMSCHLGRESWKGLPSVWLSSGKHYSICNPFITFSRAKHGNLGRGGGSWANGVAASFPLSTRMGSLRATWHTDSCMAEEADLVRAVSPGKHRLATR